MTFFLTRDEFEVEVQFPTENIFLHYFLHHFIALQNHFKRGKLYNHKSRDRLSAFKHVINILWPFCLVLMSKSAILFISYTYFCRKLITEFESVVICIDLWHKTGSNCKKLQETVVFDINFSHKIWKKFPFKGTRQILGSAYLKFGFSDQLLTKICKTTVSCGFLQFESVLRHKSIQITTDSNFGINFL